MGPYTNEARFSKRASFTLAGFTLIELMIAVAIIGVVAAIIAINYTYARKNSQVSATEANLHQIATMLTLYENDNKTYPGSNPVTNANMGGSKYFPSTTVVSPNNGQQYLYAFDSANYTYTIIDPATYDSVTLSALLKASSTPTNGDVGAPSGPCGQTGCTHIGYASNSGIFGY